MPKPAPKTSAAKADLPPKLVLRPLTPELWPLLEDLFGPNGAVNGCWCMYWRIGSAYSSRDRDKNKADFRRIVKRGPSPGLLACATDEDGKEIAVGWCQLTPRNDLTWMDQRIDAPDDKPVWSVSCFYIRKGWRRKGVMTALIRGAVRAARTAKAPALEAYPMDAGKSSSAAFTGYVDSFLREGFTEVARPTPARPILRHMLKPVRRA